MSRTKETLVSLFRGTLVKVTGLCVCLLLAILAVVFAVVPPFMGPSTELGEEPEVNAVADEEFGADEPYSDRAGNHFP